MTEEGRARTKGWSPTSGRAGMKAFGSSGSKWIYHPHDVAIAVHDNQEAAGGGKVDRTTCVSKLEVDAMQSGLEVVGEGLDILQS